MRSRAPSLTVALCLVVAVPMVGGEAVAGPPSSQVAGAERLAGSFRFVGGQRQREKIDQAVDAATEDMFPGIRGIARSRLKESNKAWPRVEITVAGSFIKIEQVGHRSVTAPANGVAVPVRSNHGDKAKATHKLVGGKLVQRMVADDGGRENTFALAADGETMLVTTRIWSDRLPADVVYKLSYARVDE